MTNEFDPQKLHSNLVGSFRATMQNDLGYGEIAPVKISSGIDPTVRFVGSHISAIKPLLASSIEDQRPIFMIQPCVRTQNLTALKNPDAEMPGWASFFVSLGAVGPPGDLLRLSSAVVESLVSAGINPEKIKANAATDDEDLHEIATETLGSSHVFDDTKPARYYRHKIGIDGLSGRNFNFALEKEDGVVHDIGNIIIFEQGDAALFSETAIGASTTTAHALDLPHPVTVYLPNLLVLLDENSIQKRRQQLIKLGDAALTSFVLLCEGLRPKSSGNRPRLLKGYLQALRLVAIQSEIKPYFIENMLDNVPTELIETTRENKAEALSLIKNNL